MRILKLAVSAALISTAGFSLPYSKYLDTSVQNLTTQFTAANRMLSEAINPKTVLIENRSTSAIAVNCSTTGSVVPDNYSKYNLYVNASSALAIDVPNLKKECYARSTTGSSISSGVITFTQIGD